MELLEFFSYLLIHSGDSGLVNDPYVVDTFNHFVSLRQPFIMELSNNTKNLDIFLDNFFTYLGESSPTYKVEVRAYFKNRLKSGTRIEYIIDFIKSN